ncbi:hypothetical protein DFJ77DRAFT_466719 [Powellomyces hirtus]|nr:hypothetical protein DFJ77DRAFT_466719 [Powellomyces hirtus]
MLLCIHSDICVPRPPGAMDRSDCLQALYAMQLGTSPNSNTKPLIVGQYSKWAALRKNPLLPQSVEPSIVSIVDTRQEKRQIRESWDEQESGRKPRFHIGDVYRGFLDSGDDWIGGETPSIWIFEQSVPFTAVAYVLEAVAENADATVTDKSNGTLFSMAFVAAPGTRLKQYPGAERMEAHTLTQYESLVNHYLNQLKQCGIESVAFNRSEHEAWRLICTQVDDHRTSERILIATFTQDSNSTSWTPQHADSLIGYCHIKLRRTLRYQKQICSRLADWQRFPDTVATGHCKITWQGNTFVDNYTNCSISDPEARLLELDSVKRYPQLAQYAPLIHYVFYRLQTRNTTVGHMEGWPEIRYPFPQIFTFLEEDCARSLVHKPEQSMKTSLAAALMWVYCFVRGFNVAAIVRNIGARHTGLVGLATKGLNAINVIVREVINEVQEQLDANGWGKTAAVEALLLRMETDQEMKWGEDGYLKGTRTTDPRRVQQLDREADKFTTRPGLILACPLNHIALEFFADMMQRINRIHCSALFIDEVDESVSSENRHETNLEKGMYPDGAGSGGFPAHFGIYEDDDESTLADNELMKQKLKELFEQGRFRSIPHIIGLSATILPFLFTDQDTPFYVVSMDVAPNYIGHGTPSYCINSVETITEDMPQQPRLGTIRNSEDWWQIESSIVLKIFDCWDGVQVSRSALITTSSTTSRIEKQEYGAMAIAKNAPFPMAAVVNNGRFTDIHFTSHFHDLDLETIYERLEARLMGTGLELENYGSLRFTTSRSRMQILNLQNSLRISREIGGHREVYRRQHPSAIIEIVLSVFEAKNYSQVRYCFLETERLCGREKSYVSFSGRETLTDLYFNHPPGRDSTTVSQAVGRLSGVYIPLQPILRERRLWIQESVWRDIQKYKRITTAALDVLSRFPGCTIRDISEQIMQDPDAFEPRKAASWNEFQELMHQTLDPVKGPKPTVLTKKRHQTAVRRIANSFPKAKIRRTDNDICVGDRHDDHEKADDLSDDYPLIAGAIQRTITKVSMDRKRPKQANESLMWFCNALHDAATPLDGDPIAKMWDMLLSPWYAYLCPGERESQLTSVRGLLAGLVYIKTSNGRIIYAQFEGICRALKLKNVDSFIKPARDHNRNFNYVVERAQGDELKLHSPWECCWKGKKFRPPSLRSNTLNLPERLQELVFCSDKRHRGDYTKDGDIPQLLSRFWKILTEGSGNSDRNIQPDALEELQLYAEAIKQESNPFCEASLVCRRYLCKMPLTIFVSSGLGIMATAREVGWCHFF